MVTTGIVLCYTLLRQRGRFPKLSVGPQALLSWPFPFLMSGKDGCWLGAVLLDASCRLRCRPSHTPLWGQSLGSVGLKVSTLCWGRVNSTQVLSLSLEVALLLLFPFPLGNVASVVLFTIKRDCVSYKDADQ